MTTFIAMMKQIPRLLKTVIREVWKTWQLRKWKLFVSATRILWLTVMLCLFFMVCEVIGGILAGSLAIVTDAAHLLTDFASVLISLFSLYIARRPPSQKMSFGFHRAGIVQMRSSTKVSVSRSSRSLLLSFSHLDCNWSACGTSHNANNKWRLWSGRWHHGNNSCIGCGRQFGVRLRNLI